MNVCAFCGYEGPGKFCLQCGKDKASRDVVAVAAPRLISDSAGFVPAIRGSAGVMSVHQAQGTLRDIGHGSVTERGAILIDGADEEMAWHETPTAWLLLGLILKYVLVLAIAIGLFKSGKFAVFALIAALVHIGIRYAELRATRYRMTTQRLEIRAGLLNQTIVTFEVHQLGEVIISSPLTLRIFGCSNLTILSPRIQLCGIRGAEKVRDLLRNAGQAEAGRLDKFRWR